MKNPLPGYRLPAAGIVSDIYYSFIMPFFEDYELTAAGKKAGPKLLFGHSNCLCAIIMATVCCEKSFS